MKPELTPDNPAPRCPRCDEELTASLASGKRRGIVLTCPEPYCDYDWSPTRYELARMAEEGERGGPDDLTRLAS